MPRYQQIGGSYGFALTGLDDGRVVVRLVNPGSPAAFAGMIFGAEILEVEDRPIKEVLDTIPVLWAEANPATLECKRLNQYRLIGRAPIDPGPSVSYDILKPSGYGYLKLTTEAGDSAALAKIYTDFRDAFLFRYTPARNKANPVTPT